MYESYFGLRGHPFAITPDPRYLYLSPHHQEALAHLLYGVSENGGFVLLTGEVGTGKTTLIRSLLAQPPQQADIALCLNPKLTAVELVATICDELGVECPPGGRLKPLIDTLNRHLLASHASGRHTVLIIDEAQNLSADVLEQIRLLTNLETHQHKLLRVILVGQPELKTLLAQPRLRQLAQRITARYHLPPLSCAQSREYIAYRLMVAGARPALFRRRALAAVHRWSKGFPRLINVICDRALLGAYVEQRAYIDRHTVNRAANEVLYGGERQRLTPLSAYRTPGIALLLGIGLVLRPQYFDTPLLPATLNPQLTLSQILPVASSAGQANETFKPTAAADPPETIALTTRFKAQAAHPGAMPVTVALTPPVQKPLRAAVGTESRSTSTSTPAAAVPSSSPVSDIDTLLSTGTDSDLPVSELLSLWGEFVHSSRLAPQRAGICAQLAGRRLQCLSGVADWTDLRAFNRPVILTLTGEDGSTRAVLLQALVADRAVLQFAENLPVTVSLNQLKTVWTGEFWLLWRPPVSARLIGPGTRGESVIWLRRQLALIDGQLPSADQKVDEFDAQLQARVRLFQRSRRLDVDGLVGARTMLLLNNIAPLPGTPLLNRSLSG